MAVNSLLAELGEQSGDIALQCSETAGHLGQLIHQIEAGTTRLHVLRGTMSELDSSQLESLQAAEELLATANVAEVLLTQGNRATSDSLAKVKQLVDGVVGLDDQLRSFLGMIAAIDGISRSLKSIADQTAMLGLNARIEATRGGADSSGFGVVADEMRRLAKISAESADSVGRRLGQLESAARALIAGVEANIIGGRQAGQHIDHVHENLSELAALVMQFKDRSEAIADRTTNASQGVTRLSEGIADFHELATESAQRSQDARLSLDVLESRANDILNQVAQEGVPTRNSPFIAFAVDAAREVTEIITVALDRSELGLAALFDGDYRPIAGTDPVQYDNAFAAFADMKIRPLLDRQTAKDAAIVGCCLVDRKGYLPTHISERSRPQRTGEREWNLEFSRNRQIFLDNQTRRALEEEGEFIVYTYRQDFGDGRFRALRSVFVPLTFAGRRWGLYEVGYLI